MNRYTAFTYFSNLFIMQTNIHRTDDLKQQLTEISCSLGQHGNCCNWPMAQKLLSRVRARGGYFERSVMRQLNWQSTPSQLQTRLLRLKRTARAVASPKSGARGTKLHETSLSHIKWRQIIQGSCSRDWTTAAAVADYKYVWKGNRTKSLSDFVQL